jgi:hypothetical protein
VQLTGCMTPAAARVLVDGELCIASQELFKANG